MTISERINLHKCGYSRAEIDALAAAEKEEIEQPEAAQSPEQPEAAQAPAQPDRSGDILAAINNLTAAIQARNVNTEQQPIAGQTTITDIIKTI